MIVFLIMMDYFPVCQCNGHSECYKSMESGIDVQKCKECGNNTTGSHCETCAEGFYGDTRNGGICKRED